MDAAPTASPCHRRVSNKRMQPTARRAPRLICCVRRTNRGIRRLRVADTVTLTGILLSLIITVLLTPLSAYGQQAEKVARVGLPFPSTLAPWVAGMRIFRQRLLQLGWIEGQNLALDFRYADNKGDQLPVLAAELVALKPDAIFAAGSVATRAVGGATTTIPIVFETLGDAVGLGLVPNLTRPGGTVTGVSGFSPELAAKQLELIREVVPRATRVAILANQGKGPGRSLGPDVHQSLETNCDACDAVPAALGVRAARLCRCRRAALLRPYHSGAMGTGGPPFEDGQGARPCDPPLRATPGR
jgi:hypothetical protein